MSDSSFCTMHQTVQIDTSVRMVSSVEDPVQEKLWLITVFFSTDLFKKI